MNEYQLKSDNSTEFLTGCLFFFFSFINWNGQSKYRVRWRYSIMSCLTKHLENFACYYLLMTNAKLLYIEVNSFLDFFAEWFKHERSRFHVPYLNSCGQIVPILVQGSNASSSLSSSSTQLIFTTLYYNIAELSYWVVSIQYLNTRPPGQVESRMKCLVDVIIINLFQKVQKIHDDNEQFLFLGK